MENNQSWGYHLILDCRNCNENVVHPHGGEMIKQFAIELVDKINMVAFGDPMVVHFGNDHTTGYTLVQLIETSNICAHFCDDTRDCYIDVFSCAPFSADVVEQLVQHYFDPENIRRTYLTRQA